MTVWWYAENDKKTGPVEQTDIEQLIHKGKLSSTAILWKEGMEAWLPLDEIEEFRKLKPVVPPPLPSKVSIDPLTYPMATRWKRFFARIFDMWWETLLVAFLLGFILNRYSTSFVEWFNMPGSSQLFGILCLPIALIIDAAVYKVLGNSPGKALLGLKVGGLDALPLKFTQYLSRNLSIWVSGLALGIPLVNLFTMAHQAGLLKKGQQASYDKSTGFRVRAKPIGWIQNSIFWIAFLGVFALMAYLNSIEQENQREILRDKFTEAYSWANPSTGVSTKVESRWKPSSQTSPDGSKINIFTERADRAIVILGVEHAIGLTLDDYVQAFRKGTLANMRFTDGGRYFEKSGKESWQGSGVMIDSSTNRLDVQVVKLGNAYWRVVTIQTMPYEYSNELVKQLQTELWNTVL